MTDERAFSTSQKKLTNIMFIALYSVMDMVVSSNLNIVKMAKQI